MVEGDRDVTYALKILLQGSVYKKANPRADINPETRDKFWDQQEVCTCRYFACCSSMRIHYSISAKVCTLNNFLLFFLRN